MRASLVYVLLVGLFGGGIVHIAILFLIPTMSERDAWTRIAAIAPLYETTRLASNGSPTPVAVSIDPLFDAVACRFDLLDGPVRISGSARVPFWSMSVYDRSGQNIFSLSDRTANAAELDLVVLTPLQMLELRNDFPSEFEESIFVEAPIEQGMAVVRGFVPESSWEPAVEAFLDGISCTAH